jgi:hypothetical protein
MLTNRILKISIHVSQKNLKVAKHILLKIIGCCKSFHQYFEKVYVLYIKNGIVVLYFSYYIP